MDNYELVERYFESSSLDYVGWWIMNGAKGSKGGVKIWMDDEHPMEVSTFAREHFGT